MTDPQDKMTCSQEKACVIPSGAERSRGGCISLAPATKPARRHSLLALLVIFVFATLALPARAHVGNKDIFEQVHAGPYTLFLTIRPPSVIPGVATVEVRTSGTAITALRMAPMLLTGEASKHPPSPDTLTASKDDPTFYTGSLWIMATGSWQVKFTVEGAAGPATASIPVPAAALTTLHMDKPMGLLLGVLGLLLLIGAVGIVMAATREARLAPAQPPTPDRRRRAAIAGAATLAGLLVAIWLGGKWWNVEAADYASGLYHASEMRPVLTGNVLSLTLGDTPKGAKNRWRAIAPSDLLADHGKLMHLYAIRMPEMDAVFHLHPEAGNVVHLTPAQAEALRRAFAAGHSSIAVFSGSSGNSDSPALGLHETLPAMPPGEYKLFADIVHANGFPETDQATLTIPAGMSSAPLAPDDASAAPAPLSAGELGPRYPLPDGYTMVWDKPVAIAAHRAYTFAFTLLDPTGKPATDIQPYLGMQGHAAFVKTDLTAFAHTHPDGSAAMPAMMLANANTSAGVAMSDMSLGSATTAAALQDAVPATMPASMPGMDMPATPAQQPAALSPTVSFPYGFPTPGRYRIFIQMKHGSTVETGVFDTDVQ